MVLPFQILVFSIFAAITQAQSVVTRNSGAPTRHFRILFYDDSFLLAGRHHGDHRDFGGNSEPGLFVHSKQHGSWLQILQIATKGGTFGKSWSENREDMKKLQSISVGWDFTALAGQDYAAMPLHTSGSIAFPEQIEWDQAGSRYKLRFMAYLGIPAAESALYIAREDLKKAFDANRKTP